MKVGVAIPAYNEVHTIGRCLDSVRAQTHQARAYVAVDASTDGTLELLQHHPQWWAGLTWLPERSGWPTALNAAAELAINDGCDAVMVMNADDYMRADAVERLSVALEGHDWALPYAQQVGAENAIQVPLKRFPLTLRDFSGPHCPIIVFGLIRARVWQDLGGYATDVSLPGSYGYNEDWDFWIRAFKAGYGSGAIVREPLLFYVMSDKQLHKQGLHRHAEARALIMAKHPDVFEDRQWAPCSCGCMEGV